MLKHCLSNDGILESVLKDDIEHFVQDMQNLEIDFKNLTKLKAEQEQKNEKFIKMGYVINYDVFDIFERLLFYGAIFGSCKVFNYLLDFMMRVDQENLLVKELTERTFDKHFVMFVSQFMDNYDQKTILGKKSCLFSFLDAIGTVLTDEEIRSILVRDTKDNWNLCDVLVHLKGQIESSVKIIKDSVIGMCVFCCCFFSLLSKSLFTLFVLFFCLCGVLIFVQQMYKL